MIGGDMIEKLKEDGVGDGCVLLIERVAFLNKRVRRRGRRKSRKAPTLSLTMRASVSLPSPLRMSLSWGKLSRSSRPRTRPREEWRVL